MMNVKILRILIIIAFALFAVVAYVALNSTSELRYLQNYLRTAPAREARWKRKESGESVPEESEEETVMTINPEEPK